MGECLKAQKETTFRTNISNFSSKINTEAVQVQTDYTKQPQMIPSRVSSFWCLENISVQVHGQQAFHSLIHKKCFFVFGLSFFTQSDDTSAVSLCEKSFDALLFN